MIVRCAWCNQNLGTRRPLKNRWITHGMCESCKRAELARWKRRGTDLGRIVRRSMGLKRTG